MLSDDDICKQVGPRSGLTKCRIDLAPHGLTLVWYSLKIFEKADLRKNQQETEIIQTFLVGEEFKRHTIMQTQFKYFN